VVNDDGKLWTFHHPDFIRDQPQLLSKIQRKTSSSSSSSSSHSTKEDAKTNPNATSITTHNTHISQEIHQEREELEKEIKTLKGQLHNMEGIVQELSQKMASVTMSTSSDKTILSKHKKKIKLIEQQQQQQYSSSTNILLNDKQLFDSKSSSVVFQTKVQSKHPLSIATLIHHASIDLPDLGKIGTNDSDLFAGAKPVSNDQKRVCPTEELKVSSEPIDVSNSALDDTYTLDDVDTSMECPLVYDIANDEEELEEDDVQTSEDDMLLPSESTGGTCSPTLIQDDSEEEEKSSECASSSTMDCNSIPTSSSLDTLLDSEHLQNLESSLRSLPMKERISFVRDVLSNIPDISSQGVSILVLTEHEKSILRERLNSDCESRSLLSQMENLLGRVGLKIQLGGQEQSNSTSGCSRSLRSSQKKKKSTKDSSFVQIEA
jgi:hypothetical protein